jgi:hypothetical protein
MKKVKESWEVKVKVTVNGNIYWQDNMYTLRAVTPGSAEDTSQGQIGIHHVYTAYDKTAEADYLRQHVLPRLHARQDWVRRAITARNCTVLDAEVIEDNRQLVADIDSGSWGGYDRLPRTRQERNQKLTALNNVLNEGAEGYLPWVPSQEDYNRAKEAIS